MGPKEIKEDIYNVMTSSRELTNYCQESVNSVHSKKISSLLNNFHLKTSVDFITKSLNEKDNLFFELNQIEIDSPKELVNKPTYNKVIDHIENYFNEANL